MLKTLKATVVSLCVAIAVFAPVPDPDVRSLLHFHDFLHVPAFAAIAALLLVGVPVRTGSVRQRLARLGWVFAAALLVGVLIELLQWVFGGDADPADVARDAAGALATLLVAHSSWPDMHPVRRWGLLAAAVVLVLACARPTVLALNDEWHARRQFPVLADFSSARQLDRFDWPALVHVVRVCGEGSATTPPVSGPPGCVAHVSLLPGLYPGLTLRYFPRDWRGYKRFVIVCDNPSSEPLPLNVRINDVHHNNEYEDRFNASYVLAPGANTIDVPLERVRTAPRGREMDMEHVRTVTVFAYGLKRPRQFVLRAVKLE